MLVSGETRPKRPPPKEKQSSYGAISPSAWRVTAPPAPRGPDYRRVPDCRCSSDPQQVSRGSGEASGPAERLLWFAEASFLLPWLQRKRPVTQRLPRAGLPECRAGPVRRTAAPGPTAARPLLPAAGAHRAGGPTLPPNPPATAAAPAPSASNSAGVPLLASRELPRAEAGRDHGSWLRAATFHGAGWGERAAARVACACRVVLRAGAAAPKQSRCQPCCGWGGAVGQEDFQRLWWRKVMACTWQTARARSHSGPPGRSGPGGLEKRERSGKAGDLTPNQLGQQTGKAQPVPESKESPLENGHPVRQKMIQRDTFACLKSLHLPILNT